MSDTMPYACAKCGVKRVRLWRGYQEFIRDDSLECSSCALATRPKIVETEGDPFGWRPEWMVPAIPSERPGGDGAVERRFESYGAMSPDGWAWWKALGA